MRQSLCARPACQTGQSLISLMVGVVVSLVTIASMLILYKTMVGVTGVAARASLRDGQVAAAFVAAQMEQQLAGFGVPYGDALPTKFAIRNNGHDVVWRFRDSLSSANFRCAGLRVTDGGMYRFPPKDCAAVADASWTASEAVAMALMPRNADGSLYVDASEVGAASLAGYTFSTQTIACLPYMQQQAGAGAPLPEAQRVSLSNASGKVLFATCLPNLVVTT